MNPARRRIRDHTFDDNAAVARAEVTEVLGITALVAAAVTAAACGSSHRRSVPKPPADLGRPYGVVYAERVFRKHGVAIGVFGDFVHTRHVENRVTRREFDRVHGNVLLGASVLDAKVILDVYGSEPYAIVRAARTRKAGPGKVLRRGNVVAVLIPGETTRAQEARAKAALAALR